MVIIGYAAPESYSEYGRGAADMDARSDISVGSMYSSEYLFLELPFFEVKNSQQVMLPKLIAGVMAVVMALGSRHFDLDLSPQQVKTLSSPWCRVFALVLMAYAATGQVWLAIAIGMFIYAFVFHFLHERSIHHYRRWRIHDVYDEPI